MKRWFSILLLSALCGTVAHAGDLSPLELLPTDAHATRFYTNDNAIKNIGDPFILYAEGAYWCYATSSPIGFRVWRSEDLVHWERQKDLAFSMEMTSWPRENFWAPEVYAWQGKYYLFYSAKVKGTETMRIGIAVADHPQGPFLDTTKDPIFDPGYAIIDASLFVDGDAVYLLYARDCSENIIDGYRHESHTYGVKLSPDLSAVEGEPVLLSKPDQAWEDFSGPEWFWNEGPVIRKHDGRYWLFYSANFYAGKEYGVGAAVADHPLGPYAKLENNPLLTWAEKDGVVQISGPGHNSFFTSADGAEVFTAYHIHYLPKKPSGNRQMSIDRVGFHADGTPYINGPTNTPQLLPLAQIGCVSLLPQAKADDPAAALLTDGDYGISPASKAYCWRIAAQGVTFTWDAPVTADSIILYPAPGATGTGVIVLDDAHTIAFDLSTLPGEPGQSLRFDFMPRQITTLRLEGSGEQVALGELLVIGPATQP